MRWADFICRVRGHRWHARLEPGGKECTRCGEVHFTFDPPLVLDEIDTTPATSGTTTSVNIPPGSSS